MRGYGEHEVKPFIRQLSARQHDGDRKPGSWSTLPCRWALLRKDIAQDAFLQHSITVQESFVIQLEPRHSAAYIQHRHCSWPGNDHLRILHITSLFSVAGTSRLLCGMVPGMPPGGILGKPSSRLPVLNVTVVTMEIIWFRGLLKQLLCNYWCQACGNHTYKVLIKHDPNHWVNPPLSLECGVPSWYFLFPLSLFFLLLFVCVGCCLVVGWESP